MGWKDKWIFNQFIASDFQSYKSVEETGQKGPYHHLKCIVSPLVDTHLSEEYLEQLTFWDNNGLNLTIT